jgi:ATPase subunit of ABC transporter with duplicated ATPase domains
MRSHVHLTTHDLTKGYESGPVVDGISLKVSAGQRLGVIGENGRGKTTLLRLLAGDLAPDQGTVTRHGSLSLVRQEMPFHDHETVGDLLNDALRESRHALSELDSAAAPFDQQRYEKALARAEDIEAWDAAPASRSRRSAPTTTGRGSSPSSAWASATASGSRACSPNARTSCCSTNRPTTWTRTR